MVDAIYIILGIDLQNNLTAKSTKGSRMTEVHAVLKRFQGESANSFRQRCGNFLMFSEFNPSSSNGLLSVGRMTLIGGRHLDNDMRWGQAHTGPLPSDACVIASYTQADVTKSREAALQAAIGGVVKRALFEVDETQMRRAPINPEIFPRLPQRLNMEEFCYAAKYHRITADSDTETIKSVWAISLDGKELGRAEGTELQAAMKIHKAAVHAALMGCTEAANHTENGTILPSIEAMVSHPEIVAKFKKVSLLARQPLVWNPTLANAAKSEGWDLFNTGNEWSGELQIQRNDEDYLLSDDQAAWLLVSNGSEDHHIMARTILAVKSPFELNRIMNNIHDSAIVSMIEKEV